MPKEDNLRTLVLFSGGKDSFVTACRCIEAGDFVGLFSCNNGCLRSEEVLQDTAQRIINRYGKECVKYEGVYPTSGIIMHFKEWYSAQTYDILHSALQELNPSQVTCLHCQLAMWVSAVAFAKARGYSKVCAGYVETDEFCTGTKTFMCKMMSLAEEHGLRVDFPVWHSKDYTWPWKIERDREMSKRCFKPYVLEPACMIGMPSKPMSPDAERAMAHYYEERLKSIAHDEVTQLSKTFQVLQLSTISVRPWRDKIPDPGTGEF